MITQCRCYFTGTEAEMQSLSLSDAKVIKSNACGIYVVERDLIYDDIFKRIADGNEITQGEINCARRCLESSKMGTTAYWAYKANAEIRRKAFADDPKKNMTVYSFEDVYNEPVDHSEKPYVLLSSIALRLSRMRPYSTFKISEEDQVWSRICDKIELKTIVKFLEKADLLERDPLPNHIGYNEADDIFQINCRMTVRGWEEIYKRSSFPNTNKVFIATQFKWPEDDHIREQALEAIKRACKRCGYDAEVVDQGHTQNITDQIIAEIRRARFVIAELTHNNRGVYYEAGYARGLGRPVFHLVREGFIDGLDHEGRKIHFDIQQVMYRTWKTEIDLEEKLCDWIEAAVGKYDEKN